MWRRPSTAALPPSPRPGDYEAFFLNADIDKKKQDVIVIAHKKAELKCPAYWLLLKPSGDSNHHS